MQKRSRKSYGDPKRKKKILKQIPIELKISSWTFKFEKRPIFAYLIQQDFSLLFSEGWGCGGIYIITCLPYLSLNTKCHNHPSTVKIQQLKREEKKNLTFPASWVCMKKKSLPPKAKSIKSVFFMKRRKEKKYT